MVLLWILALVGTVLFMRLVLQCPAGLAPVSSLCATITILYAFGLAGHLKFGAYTCLALGLVLLLAAAWNRRRTLLGDLRSTLLSAPIVGFCFVTCWGLVRFKDSIYIPWDSFSHWGLAPKVFMETGRFGSTTDGMLLPYYPPGASLLPFYVQQICGASEGLATWAVALLTFSSLLILFEELEIVEIGQVVVRFVFVAYYLLLLHPESIESVYADGNMAALFTAATLGCVWYLGREARNGWFLLPVFLVLPLVKPIAPLFAGFAMALGVACGFWRWITRPSRQHMKGRRPLPLLPMLVPVLLLVAAFGASSSWASHLRRSSIVVTGFPRIPLQQVSDAFGPAAAPFQQGVRTRFKQALLMRPAVPVERGEMPTNRLIDALTGTSFQGLKAPSFLEIFGSSAFMVMVALILESSMRRRLGMVGFFLGNSLLLMAYLAILLILYLFYFSEYEANVLASFERYVYAYMLPFGLFGATLLIRALPRPTGLRYCLGALGIASCLFLAQPPPGGQMATLVRTPVNFRDGVTFRQTLNAELAKVEPSMPKSSRVFILCQGSSGFDYWIMRYELWPRRTNADHWSVGKPFHGRDIWTADLDAAAFARELAGYDFLFIGPRPNDSFWATYGPLLFEAGFNEKGWQLFRVQTAVGSALPVRLVPIS